MIIGVFLAYCILIATGFFLYATDKNDPLNGLRFFAAPALGFGTAASLMFLELLFVGSLCWISQAIILCLLCLQFWRRRSSLPISRAAHSSFSAMEVALLMLSFFLFAILFFKARYGTGLDVWAIWKLKARFIYSGHWRSIFEPVVAYSHPAYPLLYPLVLSWAWMIGGGESVAATFIFFAMINIACAGLLIAAAKKLDLKPAWLPALFLISAPHWAGLCSSQYADAIVAYFSLAGVVFLYFAVKDSLPSAALTAGAVLGMGTFVKSEGCLMFVAAGLGLSAALILRRRDPGCGRILRAFAVGASVFLAISLLFRMTARGSDEMISYSHLTGWFACPDKWQRIAMIARAWWAEVFIDNHWSYNWGILFLIYLASIKKLARPENLLVTVFLWAAHLGYAGIYCMTKLDLNYHLNTSLDRLVVHLFPVAVFLGLSLLSQSAWYNNALRKGVR